MEEVSEWTGGIPKATYYDRYGRTYENLPADPWNLQHYMGRGLTLTPPATPAPTSVPASVLETRQVKPKKPSGLLDMLGQLDSEQLKQLLATVLKRVDAPAEMGNELMVPKASSPRKRRAKKGK